MTKYMSKSSSKHLDNLLNRRSTSEAQRTIDFRNTIHACHQMATRNINSLGRIVQANHALTISSQNSISRLRGCDLFPFLHIIIIFLVICIDDMFLHTRSRSRRANNRGPAFASYCRHPANDLRHSLTTHPGVTNSERELGTRTPFKRPFCNLSDTKRSILMF